MLYAREIAPVRAISVQSASRAAQLFSVEPILAFIREISSVAEITILKIERRTAREFFRVAKRRG